MMNPVSSLSMLLCAGCLVSLTSFAPASEATPRKDLDSLFAPKKRGFLGADGAASIPLPNGSSVWIFGDTIVGNLRNEKKEGSMVRNSIAIVDESSDVSFYWDLTDGIMGDFFRPESWDDPHWYWPGSGVYIDGKLYLFLSRMGKGDGPEGFAFQTVGSTLFVVPNPLDDPRSWTLERTDLGLGNDHFNMNAGLYQEGDTLYLLGYHDGPNSRPMERRSILGKLAIADLDREDVGQRIKYFAGGNDWTGDPDAAASLFRPGPTETALHYDQATERFYCLTIEPFQPNVLLTEASSLTGPWSEPRPIFEIPEVVGNDLVHAYTTRIHPFLSKPGEITFTYVTNTKDFWSVFTMMDVYYPRFVTFELPTAGEDENNDN